MYIAEIIVWVLAAYAFLGACFCAAFLVWGIHRLDPAAKVSTVGFRAIIVPGVLALWPLLLRRWMAVRP